MPTVALVGNAPDFVDHAGCIDQFDTVVRFNNTAGLGRASGSKTSELVLVSRGGQPAEWLADPEFDRRPAVRDAKRIALVFPPSAVAADECHCLALMERLATPGKEIHCINDDVHQRARQALLELGAPQLSALSSGYVYAFMIAEKHERQAVPISVFGFGFEGWDGHAWAAERTWFENAHRSGRLVLHDCGGTRT